MAHWKHEAEREDGDNYARDQEDAANIRQWLRREVSRNTHKDPTYGMLADLEAQAEPYYLGLDYDTDTDDVDEMGPF
jgi:hypothetical protein